jgi:hypothetical protein
VIKEEIEPDEEEDVSMEETSEKRELTESEKLILAEQANS